MQKIVCFDTDVISCFLIPKPSDPNWDEKNKRAMVLIKQLKKENASIFITSITVMELLLSYSDPNQRGELLKLLLETFRIANFDLSCAGKLPEIYFSNSIQSLFSELPRRDRRVIREDLKILTTALNLKASTLYTNNKKDFQKYADGKIEVVSLDEIPIQEALFNETE